MSASPLIEIMEKENGYIGLCEPPNFDEKSSMRQIYKSLNCRQFTEIRLDLAIWVVIIHLARQQYFSEKLTFPTLDTENAINEN